MEGAASWWRSLVQSRCPSRGWRESRGQASGAPTCYGGCLGFLLCMHFLTPKERLSLSPTDSDYGRVSGHVFGRAVLETSAPGLCFSSALPCRLTRVIHGVSLDPPPQEIRGLGIGGRCCQYQRFRRPLPCSSPGGQVQESSWFCKLRDPFGPYLFAPSLSGA